MRNEIFLALSPSVYFDMAQMNLDLVLVGPKIWAWIQVLILIQ